jgi:4-diphosphocytidyl-2-C-methyl-D-erythritol kinase
VNHTITLAAPAKINLSLRILGKRPDGFHEIETLMAPLSLADEIEVTHAAGREIRFTCNDPDLPTGSENLCVKAAEAFREATGLEHGIAISLMKRIPHGAGLGGGSSDAATVLRGFNELFGHPLVDEELHQLAGRLGSDVPFFLEEGPRWCRGRGELLEPAESLPERQFLLIKPPFPVSTAWAYKHYERRAEHVERRYRPPSDLLAGAPQFLGGIPLVNDLEAAVFEKFLLLPVIKSWLQEQAEVESAFMTGSGSTMVAILVPASREGAASSDLKERVAMEFGSTFWISETKFKD